MTKTALLYGGSLYDLAAEENLEEKLLEESSQIRKLFWENPEYVRLLSEPSVAIKERLDMIEEAFGESADRYLVNFLKLLCERGLLGEFGGCCEAFARRFNADRGIAEALVTRPSVPAFSLGLVSAASPTAQVAGANAYQWSMEKYKAEVKKQKDEESWDELEKSIVANIADEVSVRIIGANVEIIVTKAF